jgi:hypothetical protein
MTVTWDHRSLEGALYGLGRPPDVAPTSPRLGQYQPPLRGPQAVPRPVVRRLDLGIAVRHSRQLSSEDRQVILDHYVTGQRRYSYRRRKPIIGALLTELNTVSLDGDRPE